MPSDNLLYTFQVLNTFSGHLHRINGQKELKRKGHDRVFVVRAWRKREVGPAGSVSC